jgi:transposase-like protein
MEKSMRIGDRVSYSGKLGTILEVIEDTIYVVFDDGNKSFLQESQVSPYLQDTRMKSCPFCKGESRVVKQEKAYEGDEVYQCNKCSQRFSL